MPSGFLVGDTIVKLNRTDGNNYTCNKHHPIDRVPTGKVKIRKKLLFFFVFFNVSEQSVDFVKWSGKLENLQNSKKDQEKNRVCSNP